MLLNMFDKKMAAMLNMDIHSFRDLRVVVGLIALVVLAYVNIIIVAVIIGVMMWNSSMSWYDMRDKILDHDAED